MTTPGNEKEWHLNDQEVAPESTEHSQPVATSPLEEVVSDKDFEKDVDSGVKRPANHRRQLSRLDSTTSGTTDYTDDVLEAKSQASAKQKKWYRRLNVLKWGKKPPVPETRQVSREFHAGFLSLMTFQWMAPLMTVGYQRPLEVNDIWRVNPNRSADVLGKKLDAAFKKRVASGDPKPLMKALYDTFKWEFIFGGCCQLTSSLLQSLAPFVLRYLINFSVEAYVAKTYGRPAPSVGKGIGLVIGITLMQMVQSMATNHFMYRGMMIGGQARAVLIAVIFDKAMRLSGRAKAGGRPPDAPEAPPPEIKPGTPEEKKWYKRKLKKEKEAKAKPGEKGILGDGQGWGNGRIINLMSTDTYRVDQASGMFHMIWTSPVAVLLTLALLCINLTYSALAGFGLLMITMPLLGMAVRALFRRRVGINKMTDQRVSLTQEILQAVRFVKYFGWETSFLDRVDAIRTKEIHAVQILLSIRNGILAVGMSMPVFASMLSFITYSLSNHVLNPAPIFSSLALFNSLRLPLNFLPMVIGQVTDAFSSINRIQEFLMAEEAHDDAEWDYNKKEAIVVKHADFTWERTPTQETGNEESQSPQAQKKAKEAARAQKARKSQETDKEKDMGDANDSLSTMTVEEPFKLRDIDLAIQRNELIAVIGTVGSGKSSLLGALAGDMRRTSGEVILGASRAFCPQYAWIQNTTVRENIIFGKDFKHDWYNEVIDACALRPDLEMLPAGDRTEIGERGITVSGGQKQRLNIARAIYFDADIVLMDDPLSAVDAHVGRHIMDNAICGLLKDKCRILATHQLHVLNRCDRVVLLNEGHIEAVDTFDNLMAHNKTFMKLMATTAVEEEHKDEDEVNEDEVEEEKKISKKRRNKKPAAGLMQQEERAVKSVSWSVWTAYIRAAGGMWVAPYVLILLILSQGANIVTSLWLSWWTSNKFGFTEGVYIGAYAALGFTQAFLMFVFSVAVSVFGTKAGKVMLHLAINRVLRAPMSFFDTTPLGRITNRFSKDIDVMDNNLTDSIRMYFMTMGMIISVFILIIVYFHYFAVALGPLMVMFLFSAAYYRSSAREVKRHESVLRSTVFARFSEAVFGTATIRAYGLQDQFQRTIRAAIDDMDSAYYLTFANQRWLSVRLDAIGNMLVFVVGILVVTSRFSVSPSIGGLVLSYILSIVQMIQFTVRQLAEVENNMNATERIHHYGTELEEEAPLRIGDVPKSWPDKGEIIFEDVQMRYREGLPLVLQGLNMHVQAGERIGVVGRTGAGKSSIMSTLFRLVELSGGSITIDGVDISTIGLHDLRSKLAIIPQDPTLFRGTIRSNLDPFDEHTDLELWSALRQADLVGAETTLDDKTGRIHLDSTVEEEGLNFSLGQRQLMALARALVRGSQIIVCDEATSSVDFETDQKIQRTIVDGFKGKTLLCIAHRLKTIIGYDRICVMDAGRIAELDTPLNLYDMGGIFRGMCDRSSIRREDFFVEY
ncbi:P-loop containing nucleoside triphosphate hydrolase protein [Mytilinidion resinicola]|uniref:P-loop containing nucleoside triphosphate hydrolase protein n=1 Tax=Mytilinidion resinicola TaxID=574789 RepID=A0A6A6YNB7_9PEZI|nr:P-loop containing nucleoside triphosphate hydrolase protein [Mytilinidion resinicola]KAF2810073.1 P-loop containing nucleoside triphosphate hydrolase protein [Mytilinidion resinicola]